MTPSSVLAGRALCPGDLSEVAARIHRSSLERWGSPGAVILIGRDPVLVDAQVRLARFAASDAPVLLTGETGTGKELFARSLYLLGARFGKPFVRVNCAQFHNGNLMASELFGHKKGSFTGAVADHRGLFEEADGGVIFLDEVGELSLPAQAMLLRVLGEGEIVPVGGSSVRRVDVRVVAATSRDLWPMITAGTFREDLFYRLRYLWVHVPALRDRGSDWELIARHHLAVLGDRTRSAKVFSPAGLSMLAGHRWPGNVRELCSLIDMAFCLCDGAEIGARDLADVMKPCGGMPLGQQHAPGVANDAGAEGYPHGNGRGAAGHIVTETWERMAKGESFWEVVREPFIEHDLSRMDVRAILQHGLSESGGSYKRLLSRIGVAPVDYHKFMDFLRHHRLKPKGYTRTAR
jgi:DNA-binding NtrC family response regulator